MGNGQVWSRNETLLAFYLYCTIPSAKVTIHNPQIIELANALGRTVGSVKLKLQNFKSYDPNYIADGRIGLSHGSKLDRKVVTEFINNWDALVAETYNIKVSLNITNETEQETENATTNLPVGYDTVVTQKARVGQSFFRQTLMASYSNKCCITGINIPELLIASHIKPWSKSDINEKTNPQNGILLNALHDAAFDNGFITLDSNYCVVVSPRVINEPAAILIKQYEGQKITLPDKFLPDKRFIEYHNDFVFKWN